MQANNFGSFSANKLIRLHLLSCTCLKLREKNLQIQISDRAAELLNSTVYYRIRMFSPRNAHVVRLSVCPSVTLVNCDHIGWKSWKLIAQTISPTSSLFVAKRRFTYSQGNTGKFWGDYRGRVGKKWRSGEQKRQYL